AAGGPSCRRQIGLRLCLGGERCLRVGGRGRRTAHPPVAAVSLEFPCRAVAQLAIQNRVEALAALWIGHRRHGFDAPTEIARTPVGGADEVLGCATIDESIDSRVLQESAEEAHDTNAL